MTIKAILFDKDGTLLDFDATFEPATLKTLTALANGDAARLKAMADAVEFDLAAGTIASGSVLIAGSVQDIAEQLLPVSGTENPSTFAARLDAMFVKYSMETVAGFSFLIPALDALEAMGLPLGVATNDSENGALTHLNQLDVSARFCFIAGYDSGFGAKPKPGMVLGFAEHLGLEPAEIAMVGDSTHDCDAGRAAGALAIGLTCGGAEGNELAPHADHILPDISALPSFLIDLNKRAAS